MNHFTRLSVVSLVSLTAGLSAFSASADIVISGTRVVYPQSAKDVTVKMENRGNKPLLVQSWLDDGRDNVNPQELKLPFIVTPPVSRVDPAKGQTVRITWTGQTLPADRESLFWFNVLEVPPKSKDADTQYVLLLAFRTRIKMFYRPDGLAGDPSVAAGKLQWAYSGNALTANNSSPYFISVSAATITINGKKIDVASHTIPPLTNEVVPVKGASNLSGGKIDYNTINDFGGTEKHQTTIN